MNDEDVLDGELNDPRLPPFVVAMIDQEVARLHELPPDPENPETWGPQGGAPYEWTSTGFAKRYTWLFRWQWLVNALRPGVYVCRGGTVRPATWRKRLFLHDCGAEMHRGRRFRRWPRLRTLRPRSFFVRYLRGWHRLPGGAP